MEFYGKEFYNFARNSRILLGILVLRILDLGILEFC